MISEYVHLVCTVAGCCIISSIERLLVNNANVSTPGTYYQTDGSLWFTIRPGAIYEMYSVSECKISEKFDTLLSFLV